MEISPAVPRGEHRSAATVESDQHVQTRFWIVPHTHWDREWYLPFQLFRMRLVRMVDELMDTLESDPSFTCFTLDGQAVLLEDYLEARPESRERLTGLIHDGRIRIGPSYILPDEYLAGQELLVRNLLLGRQVCREFGPETPVAYYPDTFGHVAQMPQIIRGFGMDSFVFWRGLGDEGDRLGTIFRWRGHDGSEVMAIRQLDGYGSVNNLGAWLTGVRNDDPSRRMETALLRLEEFRDFARPYMERSGTIDLLSGNGTDHQRVQKDLTSLLDGCRFAWPEAEFRISGFGEYAKAVRERLSDQSVYEGEMCGGRDAHALRGVNSARMWIKQRNEAVERALLEAEIAASLAYLSGTPYPARELRDAWFHLLRNHPHDSICGCSVDEVHRDMEARFDAAEQIALRMRREALAAMAGTEAVWSYREDQEADRTAVNLLPWARNGVVRLALPDDLTSARSLRAVGPDGDLPVQVVEDDTGKAALVATSATGFGASPVGLRRGKSKAEGARLTGKRALENEFYRVEVRSDGTLDLLHKPTGRILTGAHWLEDHGDRGDEYNFCPVEEDTCWDSRGEKMRVRAGMQGPAVASLLLEMTPRLPEGLRPDRKARLRATRPTRVTVEVCLASGVDRVEFVTIVDNQSKDHRLRVVFPAPFAREMRAEGHFAVLHRPVGAPTFGPNWAEPPASTHHTLGAVEASGVAIFGRGLPEYEGRHAASGTEIALTLLRCVGWLSRDDMPTRPGHAGPELSTPGAQEIGTHRFEYALSLAGEASDAELVRLSQDYRFGLLPGPAGIPAQRPLELDGDGFCLAAMKGAEDGDGLVLRVYNPGAESVPMSISGEVRAEPCRLDETPGDTPHAGSLSGGRIASFRLRRAFLS